MTASRQSVCVFCGARAGARPEYAQAAAELGRAIASAGMTLVYGGASVGLMGALADAALAGGGRVIGVMPRSLVDREIAHPGLSEFHVVTSMHTRKALMAEKADAFIAMPGGFGTWDELFEVITWNQIGLHQKPAGLLNVAGYFNPMLELVRHAVAEGFVPEAQAKILISESSPGTLLERLRTMELPAMGSTWTGTPPR